MHPVQDADAQGHEGLGEVNDLLPLSGDGQPCHGQVGFLRRKCKGGIVSEPCHGGEDQ